MKFAVFILAAAQILVLFASIVAVALFLMRRIFRAYMGLGNEPTERPAARNNNSAARAAHQPVAVQSRP